MQQKSRLTELSLIDKKVITKKESTELKKLENLSLKFKEEQKKKRAESYYGVQCLDNHAKATAESKTIGFCIKFYLGTENTENAITGTMFDYITEVNKNSELYKQAQTEVRKTKKGFYTPFYFLQWCTKQTKPSKK